MEYATNSAGSMIANSQKNTIVKGLAICSRHGRRCGEHVVTKAKRLWVEFAPSQLRSSINAVCYPQRQCPKKKNLNPNKYPISVGLFTT